MSKRRNFWVLGGDARQARLAQLLAADGHSVHTFALEGAGETPGARAEEDLSGLAEARCVVLPLPAQGEGGLLNAPFAREEHPLAPLLDALAPGQLLFAGMASPQLLALAQERGLTLLDYFDREELSVSNGVPTAEGAVQIALEELPITLHRAQVLVLGFGRIGKLCAHRFSALGARVWVSARKWEDLAWCESLGYGALPLSSLREGGKRWDLVVNTVPVRLLGPRELSGLRGDCLVIDLASRPGGVDLSAAGDLGVRVIWALSLPGKVAPLTAGAAIRDTIYHMLTELGV